MSWQLASVLIEKSMPFSVLIISPETTFPYEMTISHLAHIGKPAFFSFVYESMNNKAGFSIHFEVGGHDS